MARALGRDREDLEGDVPFDHPRHVRVATITADEEVPAPEERVGVEIRDEQRRVERRGVRCRWRRRRAAQRVQPPFGAAHEPATDRTRRQRPGRRHARPDTRGDGGEPRGPTPPHPPRTFVGRIRTGCG